MVVTRRRFFLQQGGVTARTAVWVRAVQLEGKLGDRAISRFSGRPWPSCVPDMSSLDHWLLSMCLAELRRSLSAILVELIGTVV